MRPNTALLLLAAGLPGLARTQDADKTAAFDWDSITPSRDLCYHDCYHGFRCARLVLPLDWQNATDARTIALAVIKLPAVVPASDPSFAGPILTNPGGPGGSGVAFIQSFGRRLRAIVDKPGRRHYDIVSFDPRGMENSRPRADCFPGDALTRDAVMLEARGHGALDSSRLAVPYALGLHHGFGVRCLAAEAQGLGGGDIMGYMSTPSVARDMVEIVDKIEELRKHDARHGDGEDRPELKKRSGHHDHDHDHGHDVARLQYIGFSYGTILGNYFASMFPERIGRIVLDGVSNANDYSTGPGWLTNTVDADEIAARFFSGCHAVGPAVCALARSADASAADIHARVDAWLNAIDESPLTAVAPSGNVVAATSRDVRELMGSVLYSPIRLFKVLADILNATMAGDTAAFVAAMDLAGSIPHLKDACTVGTNVTDEPNVSRIEGGFSVFCADGDSLLHKDTAWWRRYVDKQLQTSSLMGAYWAGIRLSCTAWPFRTNWSFKGPFTTPPAVTVTVPGAPVRGKPAAPLLFLSARLDPVTPLSAARAMAALHPGAGLVVQESLGHCAIATGDSRCTANIVADYFESGVVPTHEAACSVDCGPWDKNCSLSSMSLPVHALHVPQKRRFPLGLW
ncbi:Carboxylesterase A [Tolypocladium ophioglossoides CBS 100239]|uniref:Carboxylesterase A n=1 Tax=Tolypocladium ophioglossoides (strain CBS 100239) TaxID=1163406 RepID=A0A0L0N5L5_TOLOC|nr:Carboxylesterase A [Tolypocladium ophioglossoides CBS 100239]